MSADQIREIGKGPIGAYFSAMVAATIFHWQVKKWAHRIPQRVGKKGRARLLREHQTELQIAKALSIAGICTPILCIKIGWLSNHDWRGLGIGVGLMCLLPLGYIVAANVLRGSEAIKEPLRNNLYKLVDLVDHGGAWK
jgi:hypothetical protein